jgi:phage terminase large subunit
LYQVPNVPEMTQYAIGGDTSGEGSDFFVGMVLDARTGNQVAVLKHQFDSDQYAKQMYCLGVYYKNALIGIEANFDSFPIMELQRLGYPNQYAREAQDTYTGKTEKRFGFKTTSLTRPTAISRLIEIVREHCETINDRETLEELLTIVRNEKGRIEAPEGGHDDMMMALAIAHQIRDQVVFVNEPIEVKPQYHFNVERYNETQYDYGEDIVVV